MKRIFHTLSAVAALLTILGAAAGVAHAQQTLYKYLGPDGKTIYADKPPPPGVKYEKLQPNTAPTGVDLRPRGTTGAEVDEAIQARRAKQADHEDRVAALQRNYDAAVAALEAAKVPQEGERTQNANGTSRLNENYFGRIDELQQKVDKAKDALDAAKRE